MTLTNNSPSTQLYPKAHIRVFELDSLIISMQSTDSKVQLMNTWLLDNVIFYTLTNNGSM